MKVKKILSGERSLTKELYIEDTLYFNKQKLHFQKRGILLGVLENFVVGFVKSYFLLNYLF